MGICWRFNRLARNVFNIFKLRCLNLTWTKTQREQVLNNFALKMQSLNLHSIAVIVSFLPLFILGRMTESSYTSIWFHWSARDFQFSCTGIVHVGKINSKDSVTLYTENCQNQEVQIFFNRTFVSIKLLWCLKLDSEPHS